MIGKTEKTGEIFIKHLTFDSNFCKNKAHLDILKKLLCF